MLSDCSSAWAKSKKIHINIFETKMRTIKDKNSMNYGKTKVLRKWRICRTTKKICITDIRGVNHSPRRNILRCEKSSEYRHHDKQSYGNDKSS